jgi:hypothetical protein
MYVTRTICINVLSLIVEITVHGILIFYAHGTENHWEWCYWYSFRIFSPGVLNWHHGVVIYPAEVSVLLGCGAVSLTDWWPVFWYHMLSQNFRHHIHSDMTPHPRRMKTSTAPPWKCENLHVCCVAYCGDLPISVILPVTGRQVLKILVTTVAVIQKMTFTCTC